MSWRYIDPLLERLTKHSTIITKYWVCLVVIFRLTMLAFADRVWSDEQKEFKCNTKEVGCDNVCFNRFTPLSNVRLWGLQLLALCIPCALYLVYLWHLVGRAQHDQEDNKQKQRALKILMDTRMKVTKQQQQQQAAALQQIQAQANQLNLMNQNNNNLPNPTAPPLPPTNTNNLTNNPNNNTTSPKKPSPTKDNNSNKGSLHNQNKNNNKPDPRKKSIGGLLDMSNTGSDDEVSSFSQESGFRSKAMGFNNAKPINPKKKKSLEREDSEAINPELRMTRIPIMKKPEPQKFSITANHNSNNNTNLHNPEPIILKQVMFENGIYQEEEEDNYPEENLYPFSSSENLVDLIASNYNQNNNVYYTGLYWEEEFWLST